MRFAAAIALALPLAATTAVQAQPSDAAMLHAVESGQAYVVQRLLREGASPNGLDRQGNPLLYVALRAEHQEVVQALLAGASVKVDALNSHGETPLMMAALRGNLPAVQALLAKGAALEQEAWGPLHYAASGPSAQVVQWLVRSGAQLEATSLNKTTPLMMAAGYGNPDLVAVLLKLGAKPNSRNDVGLDAADFARRAGRPGVADQLDAAAKLAAKT